MSKKPAGTQAAGKPVKVSDWVRSKPGAPVTRTQLVQVLQILVERRFVAEHAWLHHQRWHRRLWRWLKSPFQSNRQGVTGEDRARLAEAALNPETTEVAVGPGTRPKEQA